MIGDKDMDDQQPKRRKLEQIILKEQSQRPSKRKEREKKIVIADREDVQVKMEEMHFKVCIILGRIFFADNKIPTATPSLRLFNKAKLQHPAINRHTRS